ncbi:MAG: alpha/beta hydrolase [Clostridia bacterium]|nr:alpha/beta hydrolase [Clostridia bacterium]
MENENVQKVPFKEKLKNFFVKCGAVLKKFFNDVIKDKSKWLMALAVCLIFIGTLFAFAVNTSWGTVQVSSFKLKTGEKTWVVADVYKPTKAIKVAKDNKVPCVIVCPGYQRTKETQAAYNVELSRRGYAVVCLDPYSQGESSSTDQSAAAAGYGLFAIIEHVTQTDENGNGVNFDYIDFNNVGIAGHSAGGNACIYAMSKYGTYNNQKIQSAYISGYVRNGNLTDSNMRVLKNLHCNVGLAYARYDEGAYQNEGTSTVVDKENATSLDYSDMRYTISAINVVNSGIYAHENSEENFVTEVVIDDYYGSPDDYSFRVVHNEKTVHGLQPYDNESIAHMIEFFDYVFEEAVGESKLSTGNQVWWVKEIFQGLYLAGMFLFVLAEGALLLRTKFFATAVHEPQPMSHNDSWVDKLIFWGIFVVCAVFALFSYNWMATLSADALTSGVSEAAGGLTWLFPQRMTNAVMLWSLVNGALGMSLFLIAHFVRHRKRGATLINLKEKPTNVLKMLLLAFILFCSFYAIIDILYLIFHIDPRFFFVCARPFMFSTSWRILVLALMYMPLFFLFYFTNSVRVNCSMRNARWGKVGSMVIACVANSLGLIAIIFLQYVVFAATGAVWLTTNWLYVNLLWGVVPMMILLPIFNRYFYNKTGKVYLGSFVTCLIFIMMSITNTVTYLPLM